MIVRSHRALEFACYTSACAPHNGGGSLPNAGRNRGAVPGYGPQALPDVRLGSVRVTYKPDYPDDGPDPGEVVWAKVPFQEGGGSKDRPVLVLGRIEGTDKLAAVQLTTQVKPGDKAQLQVGAGSWDSQGRNSAIKLDRIIQIDAGNYRREGAVVSRAGFEKVVGHVAAFHRTPVTIEASAKLVDVVTVRSSRALEFACHSKACAPPPAGKGGSSKFKSKGRKKNSPFTHGSPPHSKKTLKKFGMYDKPTKKERKEAMKVMKVLAYAFAARSFDFACHSSACRPPTSGGTGGSTGAGKAGGDFPGTPGWTPRSMTQAEGRAEIESDIRDSENHGYSMDEHEAGQFLTAFETMRRTGKPARYGDPRWGSQVVEPGDTTYFAKLDYEVSFQADAVAAALGRPLKTAPGPAPTVPGQWTPKAAQGTIVPVKPQGDLARATAQAKSLNQVRSMVNSPKPSGNSSLSTGKAKVSAPGKVATKAGRVTVDGRIITNKVQNHGSGKGWSAKLNAANGGGLAEGRTRAELAVNAAHMAKAHRSLR